MANYDAIQPGVNQTERNRILNRALTRQPDAYLSKIKLYGDIALYDTANTSELTLNTIDANEVIWVVTDIEGWWNLPEPEMPDLPRGWGDGGYDSIGRYTSRIMTLNGSFLTQSPDAAPAARQALLQALNPMTKNQGAAYLITTEFEDSIPVGEISANSVAQTISITTSSNLGTSLEAGDRIVIESVQPSGYNKNGQGYEVVSVSNNIVVVDRGDSFVQLSNAIGDGTNVIYTTQTTHNFGVGDYVSVANTTPSSFNISSSSNVEIIATTRNTFTVSSSVTDTYVSGGDADYEGTAPYVAGGLIRKITKRLASKVRLSGTPIINNTNARGRHDFSIGLKAVDPIKYEFVAGDPDGYDTEQLTAGVSGTASAQIVNSGDVAVPIIIEISANLNVTNSAIGSCPRIQIGSEWIDIVAGTVADQRLEIDTYNREVLKVTYDGDEPDLVENGRSNLSVLTSWLYLQPGSNTVTLARFPQGTVVTIYYRSGWIG